MEELRIKIVEVSQERNNSKEVITFVLPLKLAVGKLPYGLLKATSMPYALTWAKISEYIFCRFCRNINILFIFLRIINLDTTTWIIYKQVL